MIFRVFSEGMAPDNIVYSINSVWHYMWRARGGGSMAYPCVELLAAVCTAAWASQGGQKQGGLAAHQVRHTVAGQQAPTIARGVNPPYEPFLIAHNDTGSRSNGSGWHHRPPLSRVRASSQRMMIMVITDVHYHKKRVILESTTNIHARQRIRRGCVYGSSPAGNQMITIIVM